MDPLDEIPTRFWRLLSMTAVLLLVLVVTGIAAISAGLFDPKPLGQSIVQVPLDPVTISPDSSQAHWLQIELPEDRFSLRLTAASSEGDMDHGYGLVLGDETRPLLVAVSPLGYLTISYLDPETANIAEANPILNWQTWPHVRQGPTNNEIWLDVNQGQVTSIRVNREILWREPISIQGNKVGLWVENHGPATTIRFEQLDIISAE